MATNKFAAMEFASRPAAGGAGCSEPDKGDGRGRFDLRERLPGLGMASCYRLTDTIFMDVQ